MRSPRSGDAFSLVANHRCNTRFEIFGRFYSLALHCITFLLSYGSDALLRLLARLFWRGAGNDFFEARIAAERIPGRRHFSGRRNSARTNRSENAVQFPVTAKLTPSHPPDQPATALGDGDFVNCAALARQRSHRSSLRADKFLEARIVADGIEIRIDPQHSRRQGIRIRHA